MSEPRLRDRFLSQDPGGPARRFPFRSRSSSVPAPVPAATQGPSQPASGATRPVRMPSGSGGAPSPTTSLRRLRVLVSSFAREAARVPTTWVVLLLVPAVFVAVAAPALSQAAQILAGTSTRVPIEQVAPAWSAGFVTALAVFFQVFEGRAVDRRLNVAGMPASHVAAARFTTGLALAAVTTFASLGALALSSPDQLDVRVGWAAAGTAAVYLAIGVAVAVLARTLVGGVTTILLVWILDTFFGPAMNGTTSVAVRLLPSHYATLWLLDLPPRHAGPDPALAAIGWVVAALLAATAVLVIVAGAGSHRLGTHRLGTHRLGTRQRRAAMARPAAPTTALPAMPASRGPGVSAAAAGAAYSATGRQPVDGGGSRWRGSTARPSAISAAVALPVTARPGGASGRVRGRFAVLARLAGVDLARTAALWVLLAVVPVVFIVLADRTTPHGRDPVTVWEAGTRQVWWFDPADIHAGTMAPIAIAALSMLAGVYIAADTRPADQRLGWAGMPASVIASVRVLLAAAAAGVATGVSAAVTALLFTAAQPGLYLLGNALLGVTYALLGVLIGARLGRVTGTFIAFLVPFLDIGLTQSPMLRPDPPAWASFLPGSAPVRVVLDAALTPGFDRAPQLLLSFGWVLGAAAAAALLIRGVSRRATVDAVAPPRPH